MLHEIKFCLSSLGWRLGFANMENLISAEEINICERAKPNLQKVNLGGRPGKAILILI